MQASSVLLSELTKWMVIRGKLKGTEALLVEANMDCLSKMYESSRTKNVTEGTPLFRLHNPSRKALEGYLVLSLKD